jgi:hypothetical protein
MSQARASQCLALVVRWVGLAIIVLPALWGSSVSPALSQSETVRFAVIGDFGTGGQNAAAVADLVKSWKPDFVVTTGDNNYPDGEAATIDKNIGRFYHDYIYPYQGRYGPGAQTNRFFPVLGNHDWHTAGAQPYLDYFTLPGNERYYDVRWGPVHLFILDSDPNEPDGIASTSVQATWLKEQLAASDAPWKLVSLHHPPFSSSEHGSTLKLQWPFQEWGASAVFAGHDHVYERIVVNGFPYFVNGLGGVVHGYTFGDPVPGSEVRYNATDGALLVQATGQGITVQYLSVMNGGTLIDSYTIGSTTDASTSLVVPDDDARVEESAATANFGAHTTLRVDGGADPAINSYLRFTVADVTRPIQSATLRLFTTTDSQDGLAVYVTGNDWAESGSAGITWNTRPAHSDQATDRLAVVASNTWIEFDVTAVIAGNGTYSFVLATDSTDGITFSSREGDQPPQLVLKF